MTSIQRGPIVGGGAAAAPPVAAQDAPKADEERGSGFVPSDRVRDGGIVVDRRPGVRTALLMTGLGVLGGGAMAVAASRLPRFALTASFGGPSALQWGGIAAATVGAVLTSIGLTQGADRIGYVAKVDGSRDEALATAAESRKDVGVVRIDDDSWGIVDVSGEGTDIDGRGPAGIAIGTPPVPFDSFVSKFGDAYVREGGGFENIGAPDRVQAATIGSRDLGKLTGAQVGVTPAGQRLVLGRPLGGIVPERADAVRDAFERGARDIAVLKVRDGYASFEVAGGSVSLDATARGFSVEPFASVELLTADGLVGAGRPAAAFERVPMPVDDVSKVKVDVAKSLEGRRIGAGQMRLGSHVGNFESVARGGAELFEKGTGPVVFLKLDGGVAAYQVPSTFETFDTMLGGRDSVALLDSTTIRRPGRTGEATADGRLPRVDVTKLPIAEAATLEGRRIGTGNVELGKLVKTYPSVEAAGADQFESGAPHRVVLRMDGGAAVFESKSFDGFETLLGGDRGVHSLHGSSWRVPTEQDRELTGAGRVKVIDASTLAVADAAQLVGKRFAMDGSKLVRVVGVASTHGSLAEAMRVAAGQGGDRYVVSLNGGAAIVSLDGRGTNVQTGIHPADRLTQVHGRLAFGTGGDSWSFRSRSVPFDPREPINHELVVRGERGVARTHLSSHRSEGSAFDTFDRSLRGGRFAVVGSDGPAGAFHVYDLGSGGGASWDERLGDVVAISDLHSSFNDYHRTDESIPGRETVYYVQEHRTWRERTTDDGTRVTADTGVDRTETVDSGRTSSLRAQREREREEARRREEERQRAEEERRQREAEEAERRRQEQQNSGGTGGSGGGSGGGGSGGGSGSGGNSNPGGGGGHDPGGGGAGSDW